MNAAEESDSGVVLMNQPNKVDQPSVAEAGEGRPEAKENSRPSCMSPTQSGKSCMCPGRWGAREAGISLSTLRRHSSEAGAQCGNSARWDLCGGRSVMVVPTATRGDPTQYNSSQDRGVKETLVCS
jgi:hypothetical protein